MTDSSGQVTTSAAKPVSVFNGTSTKYAATFSASAVPPAVPYDPAAQTQDQQGVDVAVTNTSSTTAVAACPSGRWPPSCRPHPLHQLGGSAT